MQGHSVNTWTSVYNAVTIWGSTYNAGPQTTIPHLTITYMQYHSIQYGVHTCQYIGQYIGPRFTLYRAVQWTSVYNAVMWPQCSTQNLGIHCVAIVYIHAANAVSHSGHRNLVSNATEVLSHYYKAIVQYREYIMQSLYEASIHTYSVCQDLSIQCSHYISHSGHIMQYIGSQYIIRGPQCTSVYYAITIVIGPQYTKAATIILGPQCTYAVYIGPRYTMQSLLWGHSVS